MELRVLILRLLMATAAGFLASMGLVRPSRVGPRYYLYHGLGTAALAAAASWLGWSDEGGNAKLALAFACLLAAYSLVAGYRPRLGFALYGVGLAAYGWWLSQGQAMPALPTPLASAHFLANASLSALLLGFTLGAMCLGHWYLVDPLLPITELSRLTLCFAGLAVIRLLFSSVEIWLWLGGRSEAEIYRALFGGSPGLFVVMRWAWGCLGPATLAYFVWGTVKIRSTQSATGILYVAVICVLVGETLSQYLTLFHGLPI